MKKENTDVFSSEYHPCCPFLFYIPSSRISCFVMFLGHIDAPLVAGLVLLIPTTTSLSLHQVFTINSNTLSSPVSLSHLYQKRLRFCEHVGCLGCPCCCGSCVVSSCWRPAHEQQKPNRMGQNDDCKAARKIEYRRG